MADFLRKNILYIAFFQALVATLGSLYFSEVMKLVPCVLCWYQRILMYPLVAIIAVGILKKDKFLHWYVLPLSILGWLISLYHNLLYYHVLSESLAPCVAGVSCTSRIFTWLGFISIPLLSLTTFTIINVCMLIYARSHDADV